MAHDQRIPVLPKNYRKIALCAIERAESPVVLVDGICTNDFSEAGPLTQRKIRSCKDFEIRDGESPILGFHDHPNEMWITGGYAVLAMYCQARGWLKIEKSDYNEIRLRLAQGLEDAASAQEAAECISLDNAYEILQHDEWDVIETLLPRRRDAGAKYDKLFAAFDFWDYWCFAAEHDFVPEEWPTQDEWPVLARSIASDLRADRDISHPDLCSRGPGYLFTVDHQRPSSIRRGKVLAAWAIIAALAIWLILL